jgi:quinohemoprotein ethanol dehydrogenase
LLSGVTHNVSAEGIQQGFKLYFNNCFVCHGMPAAESGGAFPNLGYSHVDVIQNLSAFVLEGAAQKQGMPNFKGRLKEDDVEKIKAFIQDMTNTVKKGSK